SQKMTDAALKEKLAAQFQKNAIDAYCQIMTRYPAGDRAGDARHRLQALNAPVPSPTAEALAASKAEEQSRASVTTMQKVTGNFKKHPNVARYAKVGEPRMQEETVESAVALVQKLNTQLTGVVQANQKVETDVVGGGTGKVAPNEAPPGSKPAPGGLAGKDPKQLAEGAPPPQAPAQVNEVGQTSSSSTQNSAQNGQSSQDSGNKQESTSKKKEKKGLRKLFPF